MLSGLPLPLLLHRHSKVPLAWVGPRDWGLWRVRAQLSELEGPFQLAVAGSATVQDLPHPLCPAQQQQLPGTPDLAGGTWNVLTTTSNSTLDPKTLAFLVMQHHTYHRSAHNRHRPMGALEQTARKHQTCALTCVWTAAPQPPALLSIAACRRQSSAHTNSVCCAMAVCRSIGFSGTILRSNLHESKELVQLPDVRAAVEQHGLLIWPWVSVNVNPHRCCTATHRLWTLLRRRCLCACCPLS